MTNDDQAHKPSDDNIQDQDINEPDINDLMDEDTPEDVLNTNQYFDDISDKTTDRKSVV